jgi:hypothetical protein
MMTALFFEVANRNSDAKRPLLAREWSNPTASGATANEFVTDQLHPGVYGMMVGAFAWMFAVAGIAFHAQTEAAFAVAVSIIYTVIYFTTPYLAYRVARSHGFNPAKTPFSVFMKGELETNTGRLRGWEAAVQICSIPFALALAMTGICLAMLLV